jgi:hypothetical protein
MTDGRRLKISKKFRWATQLLTLETGNENQGAETFTHDKVARSTGVKRFDLSELVELCVKATEIFELEEVRGKVSFAIFGSLFETIE